MRACPNQAVTFAFFWGWRGGGGMLKGSGISDAWQRIYTVPSVHAPTFPTSRLVTTGNFNVFYWKSSQIAPYFSIHLLCPCWRKASPQHDAAATILTHEHALIKTVSPLLYMNKKGRLKVSLLHLLRGWLWLSFLYLHPHVSPWTALHVVDSEPPQNVAPSCYHPSSSSSDNSVSFKGVFMSHTKWICYIEIFGCNTAECDEVYVKHCKYKSRFSDLNNALTVVLSAVRVFICFWKLWKTYRVSSDVPARCLRVCIGVLQRQWYSPTTVTWNFRYRKKPFLGQRAFCCFL